MPRDIVTIRRRGGYFTPATTAFAAQGVRFDGTTTFLSTSGSSGFFATDSKVGIISIWHKMMGGDGSFLMMLEDETPSDSYRRNSSNKLELNVAGAALVLPTSSSFLAGGGWRHTAMAWDTHTSTRQIFTDGVSDIAGDSNTADAIITWADAHTSYTFGARAGPSFFLNAEVAEFYLTTTTTLDLSTNISKFFSGGHPVDLGSDGSTPTGTQPFVYFSRRSGDPASAFATNRGSGGGSWTINGSLTGSSNNP